MERIIREIGSGIEYISHELKEGIYYIKIKSVQEKCECPFCNEESDKVHSKYTRSVQDLPIQGKKVILEIENRKMFCNNPNCTHKTFAERFDFYEYKSKKTKRLIEEIKQLSLNVSSIAASKYLCRNVATVGKSTICNLLKKTNI